MMIAVETSVVTYKTFTCSTQGDKTFLSDNKIIYVIFLIYILYYIKIICTYFTHYSW